MESRIRTNQVLFLKYAEENDQNTLMKRIIEEKRNMKKDHWSLSVVEFMRNVNITYNELKELTKVQIKNKIKELETKQWRKETSERSSLKIYKNWKRDIRGEEQLYDNRPASVIFYKARTNNLNLNDRKRHQNGLTKCEMCEFEREDLNHFILWCVGYQDLRAGEPLFQQPYIENEDQLIGQLLFEEKNRDQVKDILYKFWRKREGKIKGQPRQD